MAWYGIANQPHLPRETVDSVVHLRIVSALAALPWFAVQYMILFWQALILCGVHSLDHTR
jgi:hypothetical protein